MDKKNITELAQEIHQNAVAHGFWEEEEVNFSGLLMLIVSELSEALEEYRKLEPDHDKIATELADVVIRTLDMSFGLGYDIEKAIYDKMEINKKRPYKHGKRF